MEVKTAKLVIRGVEVEVLVPGADSGPPEVLACMMEAMLLSLMALDDPRIDAVLLAYGVDPASPSGIFGEYLPEDVDRKP